VFYDTDRVVNKIASLQDAEPVLKDKLKQWEKKDTVKQSKVLTGEQIEKYWREAPDDHEHLPIKVGSMIAIYGFERRCELSKTEALDLKFNADALLCTTERTKQQGGPKRASTFAITHPVAREKIQLYYNLIPEKNRVPGNMIGRCSWF
jgi:hypothetical protein